MEHLAAGDLGRHPHRKGEADHQQNGAHHACYREVAPERRDQRAFGDAGGNRPAGERGAGKARNQRHALERYRRHGRFGNVEHLRIERGRCTLADGLLRVRHAREIGAFAVEDRDRPVLARPLLLDHGLEDLDRRTEGDVVEHLVVANDRYFDRHDQLFLDRPEEQVGIDRLLFREDLVDHGKVVAKRQACRIRGERGEHLAAFAVRHQHDAAFAILVEEALAMRRNPSKSPSRSAFVSDSTWSAPVIRCISESSTRRMLRTVSSTRWVAFWRSCL